MLLTEIVDLEFKNDREKLEWLKKHWYSIDERFQPLKYKTADNRHNGRAMYIPERPEDNLEHAMAKMEFDQAATVKHGDRVPIVVYVKKGMPQVERDKLVREYDKMLRMSVQLELTIREIRRLEKELSIPKHKRHLGTW